MRLTPLFAYTCSLALILPILFPSARLFYFAPFLILSFYQLPLPKCLWWALICGFIVDLLSSQTRLGIYSINYCVTAALLYRYKYFFFEDRPSTIPVMTACFAFVSALIQLGLFYITGKVFSFSWEWVKSDLLWMPLQDAFYALIAFTLPSWLFTKTGLRYYILTFYRNR